LQQKKVACSRRSGYIAWRFRCRWKSVPAVKREAGDEGRILKKDANQSGAAPATVSESRARKPGDRPEAQVSNLFARGSAMSSSSVSNVTAASTARSGALAAVFALFTGLALVGVVGFAPNMVIHNAAHDVRHSAAFPCH